MRTPYEVKVVILLTPSSPKKYPHESKLPYQLLRRLRLGTFVFCDRLDDSKFRMTMRSLTLRI